MRASELHDSAEAAVGRASLTSSAALSINSWSGGAAPKNPAKHLLYRPSLSVLLAHLHNVSKV